MSFFRGRSRVPYYIFWSNLLCYLSSTRVKSNPRRSFKKHPARRALHPPHWHHASIRLTISMFIGWNRIRFATILHFWSAKKKACKYIYIYIYITSFTLFALWVRFVSYDKCMGSMLAVIISWYSKHIVRWGHWGPLLMITSPTDQKFKSCFFIYK